MRLNTRCAPNVKAKASSRSEFDQAPKRIEINEAFAAIVIAVMRKLGLPGDIVNIEGRRDCAWPSDLRDGSDRHDPSHPLDATGRPQARRRHTLRRRG